MSDKLFQLHGYEVRAVLDGMKTQARRAMTPQPYKVSGGLPIVRDARGNHDYMPALCPYGRPGDLLWVQETWRQAYPATWFSPGIIYRADKERSLGMGEYSDRHKWMPSNRMPRWASRLTLRIKSVRVERVQDISNEDAIAEGVGTPLDKRYAALDEFRPLWDSIIAPRGHGWEANPWVWVIEFEALHGNIDQVITT